MKSPARPRLVAIAGLLAAIATARGQTVDRVGPPSWWAEGEDRTVTLLIEGSGLVDAPIRATAGPLRIGKVHALPHGRAAFVDVTIPGGAEPGRCELTVGRDVRVEWPLLARPSRSPRPFGPDDVLYLIMPDRFADGDPANNEAPQGDRMFDRGRPDAYHGGDFSGIRKRLPTLVDLGITTLWLTPIYRTADSWFDAVIDGKPRKMADYHGYAPVDFYAINPRFGTFDDYRALVDEAHALGLKVVQDQLLGFSGPKHPWRERPPTASWFNGPLDRPPSCTFRYEALVDPHALEADRRGVTDGWFLGILPDLNLRDDRAARYAIQQSLWWTTLFEADGIRLDTFPLVDRTFWKCWSERLRATHPGMRAVGEAMIWDAPRLSFFQGGREGWDGVDPGVESLFDFPMHGAITGVFKGKDPMSFLAETLRRDHLYPHPELLTTFQDNHDVSRLASVPGTTPARLRLAAAFLLTSRGIPQLAWGDEIGLAGGAEIRPDYPGGFPGDPRDAFTRAGRTPDEDRLFQTYRTLLHLRKSEPALRRGKTTNLIATDEAYVFLREYEGSRVVVALNRGAKPARLRLPTLVNGPAVVLHGEGRWTPGSEGPALETPAETAVILRLGE
ncbi:alpha-amylase family glycosyl hydrolase [Planctomyces sp. SH-PL62]|uniref:alpha-amylase family glycosyl hydrolase n=1 Tax=Planctomyces sp. SH-PL62 TaxID=1636152 RepID=UPI00078BC61C|nr:alpha-amylase family glycosyl hydrolase [Planctomyces sp. SH-PL62]AMV37070.1 Neopullulanase [Planctomyces sp. SH-PL62]